MSGPQQNPINNSGPSPEEQFSKVHRLAKCLRRWVAYEEHDRHMFYAHEIVSAAIKIGHYPSAVNEIMNYLQGSPRSFVKLLLSLYALSSKTGTEWQKIGQTLNDFYDPRPFHAKKYTWQLQTPVKPLDLVCRCVENDIDHLKDELKQQIEMFEKLKETALHYQKIVKIATPSGFRKGWGASEGPMFNVVEDAKQECFERIYQRTRELFRYEDESTHFYHAFKLVELFSGIIERNANVLTERAKKKRASGTADMLEALTKSYVQPLEDILRLSQTHERITLVLKDAAFSESTQTVLSRALNNMARNPLDLDYEQAEGNIIPSCMGKLMLGPHVYKLMRARKVIADNVKHAMIKNGLWKKYILEATEIVGEL